MSTLGGIDLWRVDSVREGEALRFDGRPLSMRTLIQRRWGWPKRAAIMVSAYLRAEEERTGQPCVLRLTNPQMAIQQAYMFREIPDLISALCSGLANGNTREEHDADRMVAAVMVLFDKPFTDDGLIRDITKVLANRLGCNPEEIRAVTKYDTSTPHVRMDVRSSDFERSSS